VGGKHDRNTVVEGEKALTNPVFVLVCVLAASWTASAQDVWFKFNKKFVAEHINQTSGFGSVSVTNSHPAKTVHSVSCGGNDGELHIGVLDTEVTGITGGIVSGNVDGSDSDWGLVVEPVNLETGEQQEVSKVSHSAAQYAGFFRVWNEGHYKGQVYPSNPHHVLELHPMWSYSGSSIEFDQPATVHSMNGYGGYGASKFKPLLQSISKDAWLQTYEDPQFVYINLRRADNFYQLPVIVKTISDITAGKQAVVDVYSDVAHSHLVYEDLTVNMLSSDFASNLKPGEKTFILGIFSVNPHKAMTLAAGHGEADAVDASSALEFFSYGFPDARAVKTCASH